MMKPWIFWIALCGGAAAAAAADLSQPRTWTSVSGKELPAVFVRSAGDVVVLKDAAGALVQIPRAKLSLADQALLDEALGPVAAPPAAAPVPAAPPAAPAPPPAAPAPYARPVDGVTGATARAAPPAADAAGAPPAAAAAPVSAYNSPYPKGATDEQKALIDSPKFDLVPSKWFNHFKDHEDLVELQKQTGACMLVYFKNLNVSDEKGLCGWFEKDIANSPEWRKAMKYYLKIEIPVAGGNDILEALVEKYRVKKTPALYVVRPDGSQPLRFPVFEWPDGKPKPLEVPVVMDSIKVRSTPAYQTLF